MYRKSYIEIRIDHIKHNCRFFLEHSDKKLIGVVKADGYGTIDFMEATALQEEGVDFFAVSSLEEALRLRKHNILSDILILGYVSADDLQIVKENAFHIITPDLEYVRNTDLRDVKVHIKLNTGMNRLGIKPHEAKETLELLLAKKAVIEGIMSHFSSADTDIEYTKKQYQEFRNCVTDLDYDFEMIHMSATDASIILEDDICTHHRIGLGLLGYSSYPSDLKPAVSLYSEVTCAKKLNPGDTVSYGRHYCSDGKGYLLTIPLGYADGFYRSNTNHDVYVENEHGRIVGSICMDQMMILTEHYHAPGAKVELFGEHVSLEERAKQLDTISYELLTSLSDRLARVHVSEDRIISSLTPRFDL